MSADPDIPLGGQPTDHLAFVPAVPPPLPAAQSHDSDEYRCLNCGYSLRGLPADGACPECQKQYPTLPPRIPPGYVCYRCSYSLADMPTDGACPECGTRYSFAHAFRGQPYPGQFALAVRLGWPWMLTIIMLCMVILAMRSGDSSICIGACTYLVNLVNLPISTSNVLNNYVPPSKRKNYVSAMKSLGTWVLISWLLSIAFLAAPILAIGIGIITSAF